jgi:hypothetical protein
MNEELIDGLWARFLMGEALDGQEMVELGKEFRADADLRARFLRDAQTDGLLRALGRSHQDGDRFAEAFFDRLDAESNKTRFLRKVQTRLEEEAARCQRAF